MCAYMWCLLKLLKISACENIGLNCIVLVKLLSDRFKYWQWSADIYIICCYRHKKIINLKVYGQQFVYIWKLRLKFSLRFSISWIKAIYLNNQITYLDNRILEIKEKQHS